MAKNKVSYKELALGSFSIGLVGLALSIPGYLKDWRIYKICDNYFGIETCQTRAYSLSNPEQPRIETFHQIFGEPLTKSLGIAVACLGFPLAAYAAREMAEICEQKETEEAILKTAELQSFAQSKATDLKWDAETYDTMKAMEAAYSIDKFRQLFSLPVSPEEMDSEIESHQLRLEQAQKRKSLEFEIEQPSNAEIPQASDRLSENAQKLLDYLQRKKEEGKGSKSNPLSVDAIQKSGCIKGANAQIIREIFAELVVKEIASLDDNGYIYLD